KRSASSRRELPAENFSGKLLGEGSRTRGKLLGRPMRLLGDLLTGSFDSRPGGGLRLRQPAFPLRATLGAEVLALLQGLHPRPGKLALGRGDRLLKLLETLGVDAGGCRLIALTRVQNRRQRSEEPAFQDRIRDREGDKDIEKGDVESQHAS